MIGFISGRVDHIGTNFCLIDTNGVGYRVFMNNGDLSRIVPDQKIKVYTYLSVREDALLLYGFLTYDAYNLFIQLITVSGIGPKVAQGILGAAKVDSFYLAIKNKDLKFLTKLPGIGKKTAERMLLELKDMAGPEAGEGESATSGGGSLMPDTSVLGTVAEGLAYLGYTQSEISKVLEQLTVTEDSKAEDLLKAALRLMARRG